MAVGVSCLPSEIRTLLPGPRRVILAIALAGCLLRLFFWFYTGRTWEDALITVLHSENFGRGLGLTHHHPGYGPVHGFTSPLSVLIPLAADAFHPGWGLPLIRLVSAVISVPTVLLAAAIVLNPAFGAPFWLVYLLCGYLAFEHHQILWGMAGMETQVAVFAVFLVMYHALKRSPRALGVAMALCLYARPDFALLLACVVLYLAMTERRLLVRSLAIATAVYAPWVIFTTWYYGSPVPNTVVAKGLGYRLWTLHTPVFSADFFGQVWARVYAYIFLPLGPSFASHGSGFVPFRDGGLISRFTLLLILAGIAAMAARWNRFYIIPVGAMAAYAAYYVFCVAGIFGWYLMPFTAINVLLLVLGLATLLGRFFQPRDAAVLARMACLLYLLPFVAVLPFTFRADRAIQRYIEVARKNIGLYLYAHKQPGDQVGCEPLGNIGYYSRMPVLDYPGLASPEVSSLLKRDPRRRSLESMLEYFRPRWIVLREQEYKYIAGRMTFIASDYRIEKVFTADPEHTGAIFRADHNIDLCFFLLKRKT